MSDLDDRVQQWLEKQGYPFELRVGAALRAAGWYVEHGLTYADPITDSARELDIVASLRVAPEESYESCTFKMVIECKTSRDKPWVAFTAPRQSVPQLLQYVVTFDPMSREVLRIAAHRKVPLPELLKFGSDIGHGIVKAFADSSRGDPTAPFSALRGVSTAAAVFGKQWASWALDWHTPDIHVVVPVVLLDGVLYSYSLDSEFKPDLRASGSLWLDAPTRPDDVSFLRVCTYVELMDQLDAWTVEATEFCRQMFAHRSAIVEALRERELRRKAPE